MAEISYTYPEEIAFSEQEFVPREQQPTEKQLTQIELAKIKSAERLKLRQLATRKKIALRRAGAVTKRWKALTRLRPAPMISQEQAMLSEMFGSGRTWGTGESLPQISGVLRSGHGLINNEDFGETGGMFGLSRN